jgi:hypothetical protein
MHFIFCEMCVKTLKVSGGLSRFLRRSFGSKSIKTAPQVWCRAAQEMG